MKPFFRRALVSALAVGAAAVASPGCAESEAMIFIRQVQARVATGSTGCIPDASPSSTFIEEGILDVEFRLQYDAALLVGNQLVPRGNSSQLRTETSRIALQGAVVRVQDSNGVVQWGPVTVPGSGFIDPASGTNPSYGLTDAILLGPEYGARLQAELSGMPGLRRHLTAIVKVFGRTLGGLNVDSGEWQFPLTVCFGCLLTFPREAEDPKVMPRPNCMASATTGTTILSPCAVGQDDKVDCRVCKQDFPTLNCEPPHP
jgi:hypothetical protein